MFAFALFILEGVAYARNYHLSAPHIIGVSKPLVFTFGPIMYLYALTVSRGRHVLRATQVLHFLPFLLVTIILLPFFVSSGADKLAFLETLNAGGSPAYLAVIENLQYVHGIVYVVLTLRVLREHRRRVRDIYSSTERINLSLASQPCRWHCGNLGARHCAAPAWSRRI